MECNKEEAVRAKEIAQKKMEAKDFPGARKFALKAQQLYPEMENMSQMLCVCNVHCSADKKRVGNESDWYGILQIEQTADEATIKKQYRKFALLLHPDKNKFSGAEAAFKLIGEAQRVLLDKEKRQIYDLKCRTTCIPVRQNQPPQQPSRNFNFAKPSVVQNKFTSNSNSHLNVKAFNAQGQGQPGVHNGKDTFWTQCPFCSIRYQYYKDVQGKPLCCQSCKKPFFAHDMHAQGTRPGAEATRPVFPGQGFPNVSGSKAGSKPMNNYASNAGVSWSQKSRQTQKSSNEVDRKVEQRSKPSRKVHNRRGKKPQAESSESFGSESSLESEEVEIQTNLTQQFDGDGDRRTRRSNRNKRHVSYNEDASDDEIINTSKKAKESGSSCSRKGVEVNASEKMQESDPFKSFVSASATFDESKKGECNKSDVVDLTKNNYEADDGYMSASSPEDIPEPEMHEYPDPEFCDFDKDREEHCFKVGQVWAAYDTIDAMPRFYAKIRKILSQGFKLRITWLEPDPDDTLGIEWVNADWPYSNGKFKYGNSEYTGDRLMFSHEVTWSKGEGKDSVLIHPIKGETWALFKNWNANWYLTLEKEKKLEYEYVEILSEYDETVGVCVAPLVKLKSFACLFCRKSENEIQIPPTEVLRFSHKVPSCRMSGNEREGVPKDSFELDPASLSPNIEEFSLPQSNGNACSAKT
ncbi:uncharacterized protein LOC130817289 [Amaranthus tricolor]|uniref:uncharacterized protein LOC130817289 n=1 Tax=Amaranthus tricolor TaxID=29722 RepID=UPI002584D1E2|nr:uncharacterized protein LOC130817289 [Amaranthus tricolor]XP_057538905.1 uncharacterized protein LOC130817289 [Amaranthus tricolor]